MVAQKGFLVNLESTQYNLNRPGCSVPFWATTLKGFIAE